MSAIIWTVRNATALYRSAVLMWLLASGTVKGFAYTLYYLPDCFHASLYLPFSRLLNLGFMRLDAEKRGIIRT